MRARSATTEELLRIVGSERVERPDYIVAAAEEELARRTADAEELFRRKVRRSGTICAVVGGLLVVWGLLMGLMGMAMFSSPATEGPAGSFVFQHFDVIYVGGAFLEAIAGGILLFGGLALRRLKLVVGSWS